MLRSPTLVLVLLGGVHAGCRVDTGWRRVDGKGKVREGNDCEWVKEDRDGRCPKTGIGGVKAQVACSGYCDTTCGWETPRPPTPSPTKFVSYGPTTDTPSYAPTFPLPSYEPTAVLVHLSGFGCSP